MNKFIVFQIILLISSTNYSYSQQDTNLLRNVFNYCNEKNLLWNNCKDTVYISADTSFNQSEFYLIVKEKKILFLVNEKNSLNDYFVSKINTRHIGFDDISYLNITAIKRTSEIRYELTLNCLINTCSVVIHRITYEAGE